MMLSASSAQQTIIAQKAEDRVAAAVAQIEQECGSDVKSYCATVTPGEGRLIFCMLAHEDKISTKCDYALMQRDEMRGALSTEFGNRLQTLAGQTLISIAQAYRRVEGVSHSAYWIKMRR